MASRPTGQPEPDTRSFPVLGGVVAQRPKENTQCCALSIFAQGHEKLATSILPTTDTASEASRHHPVLASQLMDMDNNMFRAGCPCG